MYSCDYQFFNYEFNFRKLVCNGCHELLMMIHNIYNITITTIKGVDYCCTIYGVSKYDGIHLLENCVLNDRGFI